MEHIDVEALLDSAKIDIIGDETKFWLIRAQGGLFYDEFINEGYIALGWNFIDKNLIDSNTTQEKVKDSIEKIEDMYGNVMKQQGNITKGQGRRAYNKCDRFINELKVGDIIMIPSSQSASITFAKLGEYYEIDRFGYDEEIEVMANVAPGYFLNTCPYKKRRNIEVLKTISGNYINPNLYKALISYHGLSNIDDYGQFILSSIYDNYYFNQKLSSVFYVKQKNGLDALDLSRFIYNFSSLYKHGEIDSKVTAKLNLNSPGEIVLEVLKPYLCNVWDFITNFKWYIIIGWLSITGGQIGPVKFDGAIKMILDYKRLSLDAKKLNLEENKLNLDRESLQLEISKYELECKKFESEKEEIQNETKGIMLSSKSLDIKKEAFDNIIDASVYFSKINKKDDYNN